MVRSVIIRNDLTVIRSVERAIRLLDCVAHSGPQGVNLSQLSRSVGLLPSTAYRLLTTLIHARYVRKDGEGHYSLGAAFHLVSLRLGINDLVLIAQPHLTRLAKESGETINLAALIEAGIVFIRQIPSQQLVRAVPSVGVELPMHATAAGKAILAGMLPLEREHYLNTIKYPSFTMNTLRSRRALEAEILKIQRAGYAVDDREMQLDGKCVAAAIRTPDTFPPAAFSITTPATRMLASATVRLGRLVQTAANALSAELTKAYPRTIPEHSRH